MLFEQRPLNFGLWVVFVFMAAIVIVWDELADRWNYGYSTNAAAMTWRGRAINLAIALVVGLVVIFLTDSLVWGAVSITASLLAGWVMAQYAKAMSITD